MDDVEKITVVPLHWCELPFREDGKVDLGFGFSVERLRQFLESADVGVWKWQEKGEEIDSWDLCLVHRYRSSPLISFAEQKSVTLLGYLLAHLRVINPHRDSIDDYIQLERRPDGHFSGFSCAKASFRPNRFLCDCENLCCTTNEKHLAILVGWIPWVVEFAENWKNYYPLYLSMLFMEKACIDHEFRTRHLFRVMALEALYCSDSDFGKKALKSKLPRFLGWRVDLYTPYSVDFFSLPKLPLTDSLIDDVYTLRNKIAHADKLPEQWTNGSARGGLNGNVTYADQLGEAAGSIGRLSWLRILSENLQKTFSDKKAMEDFFKN